MSLRVADIVVDVHRQRATRAGRLLALTAQDLALLAFLVRHKNRAVSRQRLARAIWQRADDDRSNFVDVAISRLRAKIGDGKPTTIIHAARGMGYICAAQRPQAASRHRTPRGVARSGSR